MRRNTEKMEYVPSQVFRIYNGETTALFIKSNSTLRD